MKTLITLSVLQTLGIAALVVHAFREEPRAAPDAYRSSPFSSSDSTIGSSAGAIAATTDEQRLRAIIREELTRVQSQAGTPVDASPAVTPSRPRDPAADQQRREAVAQQIEVYRAAGAITDTQMHELQADIAQLDDASRKQMMSRLMRALNSGDIKGRL